MKRDARLKSMTSSEIRGSFLEFFRKNGHAVVPSSSLVPANDPTLLFTNAGMVQFKDLFLGKEVREYSRAATAQRCVRAGGKHNDLENVGYTARHHTFFEMLGNFSFGDYFKREAIHFAWNFVTGTLGIPKDRLWVTVFKEDDEAARIWTEEIGIDPTRNTRMDEKTNFWSMGETGPCGPCTEIFYDHGPEIPGGPPGSPDEDGDRYVEIWNLVFMQYDRAADGVLVPLPKPSVDTGMGLERVAAVMQGVHSNYDIDLFKSLIRAAAEITGADNLESSSLRVIADHIRACTFLIVDGVVPSNEGRGYVLRRIIRRAIRHGYKLGQTQPFFHRLVPSVVREMGSYYGELVAGEARATQILAQEENRFAETLATGMALLDAETAKLTSSVIPGETVFRLYDTYGFPLDLTADVARERGLTIDQAGFDAAMEAQRERARAASKFGSEDARVAVKLPGKTEFLGYDRLTEKAHVTSLIFDGAVVDALRPGQEGQVVLDHTPFYAESGGQIGDAGLLIGATGRFSVRDTRKIGASFAHMGVLEAGELRVGDVVEAQVNQERRTAIALNHSATHLLHAALRKVLGLHVEQKGSLVAADRLRFDFSHTQAMSQEEIQRVEELVNSAIRNNAPVETRVMALDEAVAAGAMSLFGEKYEDDVRVLSIGDFSMELCGGTHVQRAGDIGFFKILSESGVAAGVRRVEAITGHTAYEWVVHTDQVLRDIAAMLRGSREDVDEKVRELLERARRLEKEVQQLKSKLASGQGGDLSSQAKDVGGIKVLAAQIDGADVKSLRDAVDQLKSKLGSSVIVLATVQDGKVALVAGVSADLLTRMRAGEIAGAVAAQIGGRGGGRADFAQAGGTQPENLGKALAGVETLIRNCLAN
ncbi:MAG TPA: alanine--tRNA ligase [Steroidobacteraceae bacterium]|jgi:alanyl-tRNA synthetase|nr:alanine--tRNA ligase [Steroidobacteraceae bacterium]